MRKYLLMVLWCFIGILKGESQTCEEKEAFKHYIESGVYIANAHFWANRNYVATHPQSYENFLRAHPNSLFANYAFVDMVTQIYTYAGPSV